MKKELDDNLVRDFPNLYIDRNAPMTGTCMCWGFSCGDGWEPLIRRLSEKLERIIINLPEIIVPAGKSSLGDYPEYKIEKPKATQVKEKFGELRVYMTTYNDEMRFAIAEAVAESRITCEVCGSKENVSLRDDDYLSTLCDKHYEKEEENE